MAYGKIKADTLIYDNSGSDTELTLASLAGKVDANNPTLTGTVTIPTPSSGDNTTKAASTAFVVAGFAAKPASAGTVAASEVVQVDSNKDITGFRNVTLSGDLTVNGTTTTINSTTLAVDDKNIELGTVDTPTDTTADGGGITLKGASDKEIKWVDSTNNWTFNQGIETTGAIKGASVVTSTGSLGVGTHTITSPNSVNRSIHVYNADHSSLILADDQNVWEIVSNNDLTVRDGTDTRLTINTTGNATFAGSVSDSKGDVRKIVQNYQTGAYTLVVGDAGKCITITTGGVTVNQSIFLAGDAVTIINHSGSDQTITQGSSFTLYNTADASTGNRTLAGRGMATLFFTDHNIAYISGAGLS